MNTLKILLFIVFSLFLVSTASALIVVDGQWEDETQSIEINEGESTSFTAVMRTYDSPMDVKIRLNKGGELIHTFIDSSTSYEVFENTYTIDEEIYKTPGYFHLIIEGSDNNGDSDYQTLDLIVKAVEDGDDDNGDNGDDDNGQDDEDDDEDNDRITERGTFDFEDKDDTEDYLNQYNPKTIHVGEDDKAEDEKPSSLIVWIIVILIILIVLIIVVSSLRG